MPVFYSFKEQAERAKEKAKPASNQMQLGLEGLTDGGLELMQEARKWRAQHHIPVWLGYMALARKCSEGGQKASPNYVLQAIRHEYHVKVPNTYAPALARIAMEEDPSINFRLSKSRVDGFTTVKV